MSARTLHQIQQEGLDVLVEKLGPDDAIRFLQIYETGSGDWTKDRKKILENDPDKIIKSIMARRKKVPAHEHTSCFSPVNYRSFPVLRTINFADPADKARHDRMVTFVTQMLDLNKKVQDARLEQEKTRCPDRSRRRMRRLINWCTSCTG